MKSWGKGCRLLMALTICVGACRCQGQTDKPWQLPDDMRPQLNARLQMFTEAQTNDEWNVVEELLGKYRRGGNYLSYTPTHRTCRGGGGGRGPGGRGRDGGQ